jgi:large conductance mechanosensitive channel
MLKEFREFIARGNVIDLAVAVVIGAAFGKIVTSFVNDVIMPVIGLLTGKVDFSKLFVSLSGTHYATLDEAKAASAATLNYGLFINSIIDFLIVAFAIFMMVRMINKMKRTPPPAAPDKKDCPFCLSSIAIKATRCPNCTSQLETS